MAASIGLLEVRNLIFRLLELSYFTSDFDRVYSRLHSLLRACISNTLVFYVAVPFDYWIFLHLYSALCTVESLSLLYLLFFILIYMF